MTMAEASLQHFSLDGIRDTGIDIGRGSYALVKELDFRGLKCVGKEIHSLLYEEAAPRERADMLRRFEEECELLGRLHHPNIVQFLGVHVGTSSGLPSLVMEYLPTTLSGCVDTHGVLPTEISLGILRDVAIGLRYLHEYSPPIIHRDLSANNVLLATNMSAKISDLGVAKILDMSPARAARMTQTRVPGTPTYMPPETKVARPKNASCKVDIFSMGVLIVHVLSGEWPIPSEAFTEDPLYPGNFKPVPEFDRRRSSIAKIEYGHPLLGLIRQCLSNIPSRRPDAVEIVRQVREACSQVPPSPENRLELFQQVQSLRAELQQSSREENETLPNALSKEDSERLLMELSVITHENDSLRRENETLRNELTQENNSLRRENETLRNELSQEENERLLLELSVITHENNSLKRENETLRMGLSDMCTLSSTNEALQSEGRQKDFVISSLRAEIEMMRFEVASSVQDRSRTETEALQAQVQRLSVHHRAASSESPTGLSPRTRLQWRRGADAPEVIGGGQAVVMGERVYVGCGNLMFQYDWRRDTWSTLPDCPVRNYGMAQFLGKLIAVGGKDAQVLAQATGKVYQFNEQRQQWEQFLPPMPTARSFLAVVTRTFGSPISSSIISMGGRDAQGQSLNTVEVYSHASSQWFTAKPLPISCNSMTSVTINDTCFILGRQARSGSCCFFASVDSLIDSAISPHSQLDDSIWMSVSDTPLTKSTAASLRGSLIAIGGRDASTHTTSSVIHVLTSNGSWEKVKGGDLLKPRYESIAVCLPSGELLVAGGKDSSGRKRRAFIASFVD